MNRARWRAAVSALLTVLAFALVWFALVAPNRLERITPVAFLRIPVEALVVVAICVWIPPRPRRVTALVLGTVLGLLMIVNLLDLGFYEELDRPFNPVTDWSYLGPADGVLRDSIGRGAAIAIETVAIVAVLAIVVLVPLAVLRLTSISARHRTRTTRTVITLGAVWLLCAGLGIQAEAGAPVASRSAADLAYDQVHEVDSAIRDQQRFAAAITSTDSYAITPSSNLLTGLRGKDVIVAFVESYGQVAVQDTTFSPGVDAVLRSGTAQLDAAGYSSRSAFLTSPTFGGISWLAHSTLQTGLWVDNQQRYNQVVASTRFTLSDAFKRAGWHTVGDVPSDTQVWPQGTSFYHYDTLYDEHDVGYAGPSFSYASMPDQYTLAAFQRRELAPNHPPVMAEIDLVSSHTPWTPLPRLVPWNQVGNGSIFDPMPAQGQSPSVVWRSAAHVQQLYGESVQYSVSSLVSWVQQLHDNNLVLIMLGDHQPATIVSGVNANHDVPISIIAHDPAVLSQISSWGWQSGLLPDPQAPVWTMDAFRNRFLTAYGRH